MDVKIILALEMIIEQRVTYTGLFDDLTRGSPFKSLIGEKVLITKSIAPVACWISIGPVLLCVVLNIRILCAHAESVKKPTSISIRMENLIGVFFDMLIILH